MIEMISSFWKLLQFLSSIAIQLAFSNHTEKHWAHSSPEWTLIPIKAYKELSEVYCGPDGLSFSLLLLLTEHFVCDLMTNIVNFLPRKNSFDLYSLRCIYLAFCTFFRCSLRLSRVFPWTSNSFTTTSTKGVKPKCVCISRGKLCSRVLLSCGY